MSTATDHLTAVPQLGHYEIDTSSSAVTFTSRHLFGLASVRGTFAIAAGTVDVAEPLSDSHIEVDIAAASFHTGNNDRDGMVRSARHLDVDRYPVIRFTAGTLDGLTLTGMLTVRGVTSPVSLTIEQPAVRPASFTARAYTRIDRTAFGVTAQRGLAGRFLDVTMEIQCARV